MAAVLTGTPTAVTWASGANPAGQSITIPADATAVYMFWSYFATATTDISSVTLAGNAPAQTFSITGDGDEVAAGVAVWYNPSTGSQTLDPAWTNSPEEGSACIVVYVKDGDTTAWRDADAVNNPGTTADTVTLTTQSGDLVVKYDIRSDGSTPPSTSASWTSAQTHSNNGESARVSYISASGASQVCDSEDEFYSAVVAVSIPAAAGGGGGATGRDLMMMGVGA